MIKIPTHIVLMFVFIYLLAGYPTPIQAKSDSAPTLILTDNNFVEVVPGFYGQSVQDIFKKNNSPLVNYQHQVGEQTMTAGDVFWTASQQRDFFINIKVLLATYITQYGLSQLPSNDLLEINSSIAASLWANFVTFKDGSRTYAYRNETRVTIEKDSNAGSYAITAFLAKQASNKQELNTLINNWISNYRSLFNQSPDVDSSIKALTPNVVPFLHLPFSQPAGNFLKVNSFFDHNRPSIFDDSILRFDGKTIDSATFNTCTLGVSCYGGHNGIDYSTGAGRPILAAAAGKVIYQYFNKDSNQGYVDSGLIIDHGNGYMTTYWHMDPIIVKMNDQVHTSQLIGLSGNVGKSSGAHLHFGLIIMDGSKSVDPYGWWGAGVNDVWGDSKWMWTGDLVADNGEAQMQLFYNKNWNYDAAGYGGSSFYTVAQSSQNKSTNWGVWSAYIGTPGTYDVYAYWPQQVDNATGVTYRVFNDGGVNDVTVNQAGDGDRWVKLGTYPFNQGSYTVILTDLNKGIGKRVYFDAVQWVKVGDAPVQPTPTVIATTPIPGQPTPTGIATPTTTFTPEPNSTQTLSTNTPESHSSENENKSLLSDSCLLIIIVVVVIFVIALYWLNQRKNNKSR